MFNFKKITSLITVFILLFTVPISTFADDNQTSVGVGTEIQATSINTTIEIENNNNVNENSTSEIQVLSDNTGAEIRLLQLNKAINTQIEAAQTIIDNLKANNVSVDYDKLENITNQFKIISEEISEFNYNQSAEDLASQFIALKNEAKDLSNQFREEIKNTNNSIKNEIRNKVENLRKQRKLLKDNKLNELKKLYKSKEVQKFLKKYNINNDKLVQKFKSGNMSIDEIKKLAINNYNKLSPEAKKELRTKLSEERIKTKIDLEKKKTLIQTRAKIKERINLKNQKERLENLMKKFENKNKFENIKERLENESNKFNEKDLSRFMNNEDVKNFIKEHSELLVQLRSGNISLNEMKKEYNIFKKSKRRLNNNSIEIHTGMNLDNDSLNINGGMNIN